MEGAFRLRTPARKAGGEPRSGGAAPAAFLGRVVGENVLQGAFTTDMSRPRPGFTASSSSSRRGWCSGFSPLAVRDVLPVLGGSPAVWNTAMVFFQAALLAGYAFAHFLVRRVSPTGQIALLGALWVGVALTAPAGELRLVGDVPGDLPPVIWLLGTLAGALGLAFVAASSLTPLVQAWLARAGSGAASVDPYFLYAASNAGSAGALTGLSVPARTPARAGPSGLALERRSSSALHRYSSVLWVASIAWQRSLRPRRSLRLISPPGPGCPWCASLRCPPFPARSSSRSRDT